MNGRKRSADEAFQKQTSQQGGKIVTFHDLGSASQQNGPSAQSRQQRTVSPSGHRPNLKQRANALLETRQQLPIWPHAATIRSHLRSHDVLLLVGETGSGKSTQIPQFLLTEPWCRRRRATDGSGREIGGCIAITQPRRVAAISLARRVAEEMGTPVGGSSPAAQVGYSVRFERGMGPAVRIKFLTEGMLLQEMLRDPWLSEYSCVVVDEVHERGANVDLVLGFLRRLLERREKQEDDGRGGVGLKVVVMSATADMEGIKDFFDFGKGDDRRTNGHSGGSKKSGSNKEEQQEQEEWDGFSDADETKVAPSGNSAASKNLPSRVSLLYIKGRQYPVEIHYTLTPVSDILDAAYQRIIHIHSHSPLPGDILVFLTGQETVESLFSLIESYSQSIRKDPALNKTLPHLLLFPLYAALPSHLQQRVFQPTPKFTRKVILATNIAETSITVPGVRHVIDTGKHKRRLFRPSLNLDSLLTTPISRSSAAQRSGRAGRDGPGHAYRLYTESDYYSLAADTEPEILRCDLSQLVLTLKAHGVDNVATFPLLTQPPRRALERSMIHLLQLNALSPTTGAISSLGKSMSTLPLPAPLARILLASTEPRFDCVDEIIDIVAALSVENLFLNIKTSSPPTAATTNLSLKNEEDNDDNSQTLDPRLALRARLHRHEGDHLTLLAAVQAYVAEDSDRKRWCEERAISHRAMQAVVDVRKQLAGIMEQQLRQTNRKEDSKTQSSENGESRTKTTEKKKQQKQKNSISSDPDPDLDPTTTATTTTPTTPSSVSSTEPLPNRILKTLLTGLHPHVARLSTSTSTSASPRTSTTKQSTQPHSSTSTITTTTTATTTNNSNALPTYLTIPTNQPLAIHPSSVLFGRRVPVVMYSEFVFTNRAYARGVSAVEGGWMGEVVGGYGI